MNAPDPTDDDLRELFRPHREVTTTHATEADLAATRSRSIARQRGRVLGGTAAVALLAVGGGALALTGGANDSTDVVRSAAIEDTSAENASAPTAERTSTTPNDDGDSTDPTGAPEATNDDIDAWLADFPLPPVFDATDLPPLPVFDQDDSSAGEGLPRFQVELDRLFEAQRVVFGEWAVELSDWFDDRPDGEIVIGPDRLFEAGTLNDFIADDLAEIDPAFTDGLDRLDGIEVVIGDDSIEIDVDGDGVADEVIELSEVQEAWTKLAEFDFGEFGLGEFDLSELELDQLLEKFETDLDGIDLDALLEDFDLGDVDWEAGELPDLSELDLPDGADLPTEAEIDELLEELDTEMGGLDLEDFDLEDFDFGDLFDSEELDDLFGG